MATHYENRIKALYPVGSVYSRLTVTGYVRKTDGWAVTCDCACGKTTVVRLPNQMRRGLITSCGCRRSEETRARMIRPPGEADFKRLLGGYLYNAQQRGLSFTLSAADFRAIVIQPCCFCGALPTERAAAKRHSINGAFACNGLDRIDSEKGYEPTNVQPCCKTCNYAKRQMSVPEFLAWVKRVCLHRSL